MIMIRYIYVFGVSNVLISSFKSPPHAHPLFFTYNLRFGLDSEQENGTLICSEPKNGFRLRALCYTILKSIFDAYEGGKVKSSTLRSF